MKIKDGILSASPFNGHTNGNSVESVIVNADLAKELKEARVTYDPNFKGLEPVISLQEGDKQTPMLHKGGISTALAHVKSGKTFLMWLMAFYAAKIAECFNIVSHLIGGDLVAIFDTEQGHARCQRKFNNYFPDTYDIRVDVFSLRQTSIQKILGIIELYISTNKPKLIFIDIGSDLVSGGVNDLHGSDHAVNTLSALAEKYDMHIVVSLHLSRSKGEAMGHFGSVLLKRSESVFTVKKVNEYFVVKPLYTRDEPWKPWAFQIQNNMGIPTQVEADVELDEDHKAAKLKSDFGSVPSETHKNILCLVFDGCERLQPKDFKLKLKAAYAKQVSEIGLQLVKELQRFYVENGYLLKDKGLLYLADTNKA